MITHVAIKKDNVIYMLPKPSRHCHLFQHFGSILKGGIQGFSATDVIFLDRIEAADYVLENGQISKLAHPPNLYSEDLW